MRISICVSDSTTTGMLKTLDSIMEFAQDDDVAAYLTELIPELRTDFLTDYSAANFKKLVRHTRLPVIGTHRIKAELGNYDGSPVKRIRIALEQADAGARYVDVEHRHFSPQDFAHYYATQTRMINSWHDKEGTPPQPELSRLYMEMLEKTTGLGGICKLVSTANSPADADRMCRLLDHVGPDNIIMCMGEYGRGSRTYCGRKGFLTYAVRTPEEVVAPGQPTFKELISDCAANGWRK